MPDEGTAEESSKSSEEDRISALPDDVLRHVLGFLQAHEAVHTGLLARRWRHLWKSMRCINIDYEQKGDESTDVCIIKFVNFLLLLRDPGFTLDEVKIKYNHWGREQTWINIWIRHALSCQAQALIVERPCEVENLSLDGPPLVSRFLKRLEFSDVIFQSNILDFSSCSALEDLKIRCCYLETSWILSKSLKHLRIKDCLLGHGDRVRISVPNLVSLQLIQNDGRAPLLEILPSLETAVFRHENYTGDNCRKGVAGGCCGICADCCGNDDHNGSCILLGGLSHAKNLEIKASPRMFIFRRDLRWCPTFSKLKTLLLNDWCVQPDLRALFCMLEHSPILENLMLQLRKQEKRRPALEVEENHSLMEKPAAISGYLKLIKVKCDEVDDRVCKVMKSFKYIWHRNYYPKD